MPHSVGDPGHTDAHNANDTLVASKAPLAAPALTGAATLDGSPLLSQATGNAAYVHRVADATGTTATDTAAVQDAINNNKRLGSGTYIVSKLTPVSGAVVQGLGRDTTTIKLANGQNGNLWDETVTGITDMQVIGVTLDGNKANQTTGSPCYFVSPVRLTLSYVRVINAHNRGIQLDNDSHSLIFACDVASGGAAQSVDLSHADIALNNCVGTRVLSCTSDTSADAGIANIGGTCTDCIYQGNTIRNPHFIGIAFGSAGARLTATGNTVSGSGDNAIDGGNCTGTTITGNTAYNCHAGIVYDFSTTAGSPHARATITGNVVDTTPAGGSGVAFIGPAGLVSGVTITGNVFSGCGGSGIEIQGVTRSTITGNTVKNPGAGYWAINVGGTCTYNNISHNICHDDQGLTPTSRGIECYPGSDHNTYAYNDLSGVANPFWDTPNANDLAVGNRGWNPRGHSVTQPAVPGSTVAQTNTTGVNCTVIVTGGTVTAIAIGGTATGLTSGTFRVPVGQTITLTYSVAPTWQWFGD